jgi:hypothetical protein
MCYELQPRLSKPNAINALVERINVVNHSTTYCAVFAGITYLCGVGLPEISISNVLANRHSLSGKFETMADETVRKYLEDWGFAAHIAAFRGM